MMVMLSGTSPGRGTRHADAARKVDIVGDMHTVVMIAHEEIDIITGSYLFGEMVRMLQRILLGCCGRLILG